MGEFVNGSLAPVSRLIRNKLLRSLDGPLAESSVGAWWNGSKRGTVATGHLLAQCTSTQSFFRGSDELLPSHI